MIFFHANTVPFLILKQIIFKNKPFLANMRHNLQKVTKCTQNNLVSTILVSKSIIGFVLF